MRFLRAVRSAGARRSCLLDIEVTQNASVMGHSPRVISRHFTSVLGSALELYQQLSLHGVQHRMKSTGSTSQISVADKIKEFTQQASINEKYHQPEHSLTIESMLGKANEERVRTLLIKHKQVKLPRWAQGIPRAAVLIPLCHVRGEPSVLFTLRSSELNSYRGQVSFPGGKLDETDASLVACAMRETEEELGITPEQINTWGEMAVVPSRNYKMAVTPVIAYCGEIDPNTLSYNKDEVASVFHCPIKTLCAPGNAFYTQFRSQTTEFRYTIPVFLGTEHRVWGLTGIVLYHTLTLIAPGLFTFKLPGVVRR